MGFAAFSPDGARRIAKAVNKIERMPRHKPGVVMERAGRRPGPDGRFLAKITGHAVLASRNIAIAGGGAVAVEIRWVYAWVEVQRDGDGVSVVSGGRSGTTGTNGAINILEINHADVVWGVDLTGSNYPLGFRPRPIGGGGSDNTHKQDIIVEMIEAGADGSGVPRYTFEAIGSHDGSCAA